MTKERIKNILKPLEWYDLSSVDDYEKGMYKIGQRSVVKRCLVFEYAIWVNPHSKELPYLVFYGGHQPKEVESIEAGKKWVNETHYPSKMAPFININEEVA